MAEVAGQAHRQAVGVGGGAGGVGGDAGCRRTGVDGGWLAGGRAAPRRGGAATAGRRAAA